jgi:hypothetical protein
MKKEVTSLSGGDRKYRIKKDTLSNLENSKVSQFEKHLIQEGVKQVLFAQGSEEVETRYAAKMGLVSNPSEEYITYYQKTVPKETIRFLLDYDVIEEYKF